MALGGSLGCTLASVLLFQQVRPHKQTFALSIFIVNSAALKMIRYRIQGYMHYSIKIMINSTSVILQGILAGLAFLRGFLVKANLQRELGNEKMPTKPVGPRTPQSQSETRSKSVKQSSTPSRIPISLERQG